MFEKALIIGGFNPLHECHEYLFSKAQKYSKSTDIYIGNKKRAQKLSREIRKETVKKCIKNNEWENAMQTTCANRHLDLNGEKYDLIITGSDLLNTIYSKNERIAKIYGKYFLSFPNILSISRKEIPLEKNTRTKLIKHTNLIEIPGFSNISSEKIRQTQRDGNDISKMVSKATWKIIKDHIHIFKN